MAAKQLVFSEEARRSLKHGVDVVAERRRHHPRPQGPQRGPGQEIRLPHHHP